MPVSWLYRIARLLRLSQTSPPDARRTRRARKLAVDRLLVRPIGCLFRRAFNRPVLQEAFLPQLFSIAFFRGGQRAGRRPVSTRQTIKEGTQPLHTESLTVPNLRRCSRAPGIERKPALHTQRSSWP